MSERCQARTIQISFFRHAQGWNSSGMMHWVCIAGCAPGRQRQETAAFALSGGLMPQESILAPYVRKLERRRRLDDAERAALLPHRARQLDRSAYISREGEDTKNCQILLSGFAQSSRTDARGARALLALHMEGEPLNICGSADEKSPCDVQALSPLTIASIPNNALISLGVSYPSIAIALWRLAARNASVLSEWLMNVGRRDAQPSHLRDRGPPGSSGGGAPARIRDAADARAAGTPRA